MLSEANICLRWLEECGRIDPIYPTDEGRQVRDSRRKEDDPHWYRKWLIRVNPDGHLIYEEGKRTVELARFVGERRLINQHGGAVLLNGDGFESSTLQEIQTRLRNRARGVFNNQRVMVIPYQALTGAELVYDSLLPIHVSGDTWTDQKATITAPPPKDRPYVDFQNRSSTFNWGGKDWRYQWTGNSNRILEVQHQPPNGTFSWHTVRGSGERSYVNERVHNLGSSVFSAVGPDGDRHRYVSAFDTQEQTPMYFLAQLPDQGKCTSYIDALALLAPPIVHQARRDGKRVYRQGDVFAVETDMKDEDLPEGTKVVRRDQVFAVRSGTATRISKRSVLRKRLMIYGTGHTATIIAILPNGVTLGKGTMFHDPVLERAGRTREHRNVTLNPIPKWFLFCRNTVPRATTKQKENTSERNSNTNSDVHVRLDEG